MHIVLCKVHLIDLSIAANSLNSLVENVASESLITHVRVNACCRVLKDRRARTACNLTLCKRSVTRSIIPWTRMNSDQTTGILGTKDNVQSSLHKLASKRVILETQRDKLLFEADALAEKIAGVRVEYGTLYNATIPPISSLPNETLCIIFLEAVDNLQSSVDDEYYPGKQRDRIVLAISHVCKNWRDTAIRLPNLWTTFTFDDKDDWRTARDRFDTYLHRAGPLHLLEFNFDFSYPGVVKVDSVTEAGRAALLNATIPYVERWRKISVVVLSESIFEKWINQLTSLAAPNLECFCLSPYDFFQDDLLDDIQPAIFKRGAPKLTSVYVDDINPLVCLPPLNSITTLHFNCPHVFRGWFTWNAFLKIAAIPSLTHLSILGYTIGSNWDPHATYPIAMSNLEELELSRDQEFIDSLLTKLVAPSLNTLTLHHANFTLFPRDPEPFPTLRNLSLNNFPLESDLESFQCFVHKTSLVEQLSISYKEGSIAPPFELPSTAVNEHLWPKLHHVAFQLREWRHFEPYRDLIRSSNAAGLPIDAISLPSSTLEAWEAEDHSEMLDIGCKIIATF